MIPIIAVVGPTASGKTNLAIALAEHFDAEIISADSMQVYKGMEIGSAAPTPEEQARVRHHLAGFLDPGTQFSAGDFQALARPLAARMNANGKPAIVAGGSGLYVRALIDGLFDGPPAQEEIRRRLESEAERDSVASLYARLQEVDPEYASLIFSGDLRRIVRALEVFEITGVPLSRLHQEHRQATPPLPAIQVALDYERPVLYERINQRAEIMLAAGFIEEVARLVEEGYGPRLEQLRTLGYREFAAFLRGERSRTDALDAMKQNTRRFAKRQLCWFRGCENIVWLPMKLGDDPARHLPRILELAAEAGGE